MGHDKQMGWWSSTFQAVFFTKQENSHKCLISQSSPFFFSLNLLLKPLFFQKKGSNAQSYIRLTMQMISSRVDNCVQFVDKTTSDLNYVDIIPNDSGCYSYVCVFLYFSFLFDLFSIRQSTMQNVSNLLFNGRLEILESEVRRLLQTLAVRETRVQQRTSSCTHWALIMNR